MKTIKIERFDWLISGKFSNCPKKKRVCLSTTNRVEWKLEVSSTRICDLFVLKSSLFWFVNSLNSSKYIFKLIFLLDQFSSKNLPLLIKCFFLLNEKKIQEFQLPELAPAFVRLAKIRTSLKIFEKFLTSQFLYIKTKTKLIRFWVIFYLTWSRKCFLLGRKWKKKEATDLLEFVFLDQLNVIVNLTSLKTVWVNLIVYRI